MMPEFPNPLSNAKIVGENVNPDNYHAEGIERGDPAFVMSQSHLKEFNGCPARWKSGYSGRGGDGQEWGTLMDILVTAPEQFQDRVAVCPKTYPSEGKGGTTIEKPWTFQANFCKDWKLEQGDKLIVKDEEYKDACKALEVLFADKEIAEIVKNSRKQVALRADYRDKETGIVVPIKCLLDLVPDIKGPLGKSLADFKTGTSAAHHAWVKTVFDHGLHIQAALYLDAYTLATGEDRVDFRHIIQESFPPFQVGLEILSAEYVELGRASYIGALRKYCQCLATGIWPGYAAQVQFDRWNLCEPSAWMVGL